MGQMRGRSVGPQYILLLALISYTPLRFVRNVAREEYKKAESNKNVFIFLMKQPTEEVLVLFTFKLYCDLETGVQVTQGHRRWHYSIEHIHTPLYSAPPLVTFTQQPFVAKN